MASSPSPDALRKLAEEALALAEKASPGPWEWDGDVCHYDPEQEAPWLCNPLAGRAWRVIHGEIRMDNRADAELIAAARTSLPALASAYLAATRSIAKLRTEVKFLKASLVRAGQPGLDAMMIEMVLNGVKYEGDLTAAARQALAEEEGR